MNESEIIQRINNGETQLFSLLVEQYKNKVFNLVYRFTSDYAEAEDLSQEIFITVFQKISSFQQDASFSTWIYRVATNKCIDWHRKKKRKRFFSLFGDHRQIADVEADAPSPSEVYLESEEQKMLHKAVGKLDEKYKMIVVMFYYQHLSYKQIAEVLNLPVRTIETRLYRAKKILKDKLAAEGYGGELYEAGQC